MAWLARTAVHEAFKLLRRDRRELSLDAALEDGAEPVVALAHADAPRSYSSTASGSEMRSAAGASAARRVATCSRAQLRRDGGARRLHEADGRPPAPAGEASDPRRVAIELKRRLRRGRAASVSLPGPAALAPAVLRLAELARLGPRLGAGPPALGVVGASVRWPLGACWRASRQMKNEIPPSTTIAPTAMEIAELPLSPLPLPAVAVVWIVGVAVVVVGVETVGCGKPGESGFVALGAGHGRQRERRPHEERRQRSGPRLSTLRPSTRAAAPSPASRARRRTAARPRRLPRGTRSRR